MMNGSVGSHVTCKLYYFFVLKEVYDAFTLGKRDA